LETTTAIYDQDKGITILRGIMRDITEKRKLENKIAQTQKMETIGSLAGGIAHDFNNLLTVINGYTEMILSKMDTNNPFYNKIKSVQDAGERAANITNQLLAFSRKQIYKTEIVNINEIISSMDKMLRRLIGEDIHIEKILTGNLPNIKADKSQLEQIFINLMVNARDAIRNVDKPNYAKKIIIETGEEYLDSSYVEKHPDCNLGRHVFFAVSDNGSGIDKETMNKIFDPFFTTKEKGKGTGLGLSTVYGIVKQNNGSVNVYSEPGKGTMFKIYWPATAEKNSGNEKQIYDEIYYGNETILFVEDEDDVRRFTSESLTSLGYNVYMAENGYAALKLIKDQLPKIDLIITDLIMPKLNGKEFVLEAQKIYPGIKVIYISGYTDNHILHNGLLEKGVNFIHKPYSINKLASTVRKVLNNE
jgi:signal transduction histidine kinase/CheY-like chemotaxis protein